MSTPEAQAREIVEKYYDKCDWKPLIQAITAALAKRDAETLRLKAGDDALAQAGDVVNSWCREEGLPECDPWKEFALRNAIDGLWSKTSAANARLRESCRLLTNESRSRTF